MVKEMETNLKIRSNKELKLLLLAAITVTLGTYVAHLKVGLDYTRKGIISGFVFGGLCGACYGIANLLE